MPLNIQPKHLKLAELLENRLFRIPEYQRSYSWEARQRRDLFEDITKVAAKKYDEHFMATIVGLKREKISIIIDEYSIIEIVDGQQRLTTLIILLKAIEQRLNKNDKIELKVKNDLQELLVKPDNTSPILLQTNHDSSNLFSDFLRCGDSPSPKDAKTLADRNLLQAIRDCFAFIDDWKIGSTIDLVALVKNKLSFIFHEISDESIVYTVFETLNSRGLDVSWFDRLKSIFMGLTYEYNGNKKDVVKELHSLWSEIYRIIDLRQGLNTEAMRFAATMKLQKCPRRILGEADSVEVFREISNSHSDLLKNTKWIKEITNAVDKLWKDKERNAVSKIAHTRLVAVAVNSRKDFARNQKKEILYTWEKVTFRIYGLHNKDARTGIGDYTRLAWRIVNESISQEEIQNELNRIGNKYPIKPAIDLLVGQDCYNGWTEELRYIFHRYEEFLSRKKGQRFKNRQWIRIWEDSPVRSIEHILPQSTQDSEDFIHRLGNLTILPPNENSSLGNKKPLEKKKIYQQTGLLLNQEINLDNWKNKRDIKKEIISREKALLAWIAEEWG